MSKLFKLYGVGQAIFPVLPPPIPFENPPTDNQTNYEIGQVVFTPPRAPTAFYLYAGAGNWVEFASSSGNILAINGTANQIAASTTAGTATLSLPNALVAPGSLASTSTITVGTKLLVTGGANTSIGVSGAMTAGSVTVANTSVTANSLIFAYPATLSGAATPQGYYISARVPGTSFTIQSGSASDTSTWNYWIIN